ncbi:MAG: hypothetical protein HOP19_28210 [Acidobacteria bacterium]|nr:hypothetical protein [Acidobacteriota bacterium]
MKNRDSFTQLSASHLVDAELKVAIRLERFNLEMHGVQEVAFYYDPELRADRLRIPYSEAPYAVPNVEPAIANQLIPFSSMKRVQLWRMYFGPPVVHNECSVWSDGLEANNLGFAERRIQGLNIQPISSQAPEFVLYCLRNLIRFPAWDELVSQVQALRGAKTLALTITHSFAGWIETRTGASFATWSNDACLLATRDLQP